VSTLYHNSDLGTWVRVSRYAERLIGAHNVQPFVEELMKLMHVMDCDWAYVSKSGAAVEIYVHHKNGWSGTMKVKREK